MKDDPVSGSWRTLDMLLGWLNDLIKLLLKLLNG